MTKIVSDPSSGDFSIVVATYSSVPYHMEYWHNESLVLSSPTPRFRVAEKLTLEDSIMKFSFMAEPNESMGSSALVDLV
jgi:hypothetical protein